MILYCNKFKSLVLKRYNNGGSIKDIVSTFEICRKTLYNWRMQTIFKKQNPKKLSNKYSEAVREYVSGYAINNSRFNVRKLVRKVNKRFKCKYTAHNLYYLLKKLNITYKKAKRCIIIDKRKHTKEISKLIDTVNKIGHDNVISIDESHYQLNMNNTYGWNYKGSDVTFRNNNNRRLKISLLLAVSNRKVICKTIVKGSVNSNIFSQFIKKVNRRVKNKHLLMDNARIHRSKKVTDMIKKSTNKQLFNVPYNPQTNPIEKVFNKSKILIKEKLSDTYERLLRSIKYTLNNVTGNDLSNFYINSFTKN